MTSGKPAASPPASVEETAARWVARLALKNVTESDLLQLGAWLAASPAHQAAFDDARATWTELPSEYRPPIKHAGWRSPRAVATFAAVAAAACAVFVIGAPHLMPHDLASPTGAVRTTTLADGTRLWLDSDSAADFHIDSDSRTLRLARGRVHIAVAADPQRPLTVKAAGYDIKDIGTAFTVDASGTDLHVAVTEGRVDVKRGNAVTALTAGKRVVLNPEHAAAPESFNASSEAAWRDGRILLDQMTLRAALTEIERYRPGRIILLDDELGNRRVSGTLAIDDLDSGLNALAATQRLRFQNFPYLLIVSAQHP